MILPLRLSSHTSILFHHTTRFRSQLQRASPPATAVWKAAGTRPATQRGDIVFTPMLKMVTLTIQAPPAAISASPVNHGEALNATTNEARPRMTTPPVTDVSAPGLLLSGDTQNAPMTAPIP